jgi:N6-L-threonylcarbamoyladenine synthase
MIILSIETSCDETAISIVRAGGGFKNPKFEILSNVIASQIKIHAKWGGVVPNLAKREHQANLITVLEKCLKESNLLIFKSQFLISKQIPNPKSQILNSILKKELKLLDQVLKFIPKIKIPKIDAIAVTVGPGLEPALWVGINFAKALSKIWNKPIIGINHMEGHIVASLLNSKVKNQKTKLLKFPAVALLVSGGHTELVLIKDWLKYKIIGQTRDDAAGEAFDKVAKMLGLPYPGGPAIAAEVAKLKIKNLKLKIKLPRPMINSKDYDFSFSGLKTAVLYLLQDIKAGKLIFFITDTRGNDTRIKLSRMLVAEICQEFQQAVIDVLIKKTLRAVKEFRAKTVILGGGVVANEELRKQFSYQMSTISQKLNFFVPSKKFCTDNAVMIAIAAYFRVLKKSIGKLGTNWKNLKANGNLKLK